MICVSISREVDCLVSNSFRDVVLKMKAAFGKMRIGHAWLQLVVPMLEKESTVSSVEISCGFGEFFI